MTVLVGATKSPAGGKRTWDKVKELAPHIFPRKKLKGDNSNSEPVSDTFQALIGKQGTQWIDLDG